MRPRQHRRRHIVALFALGVLIFQPPARGAPTPQGSSTPEPAERIRERVSAAGDAAKHNADVVVALDLTQVTVAPNGIGTALEQRVVKVLRDGGIRRESVQRIGFDPNTNRVRLIAIRVYRADGSLVEVPSDAVRHQPDDSRTIYWGSEQFVASVPRLAIGDAVETVVERTGFNVAYLGETDAPARGAELVAGASSLEPPVPGHWHDEVHFWSSVPIAEKRYSVRVPKDKPLQYEVYNGELRSSVAIDGEQLVYTFEKKDIPAFSSEAKSVPAGDVMPKLLLATLPDWESKSRWLYGANEPQFELNDDIRRKVSEITAGCSSDEERIYALNRWVADSIRYVGTSRGACEGYTVHSAAETFRDRGGVCKDKAGMLTALLRAAGFQSYVAMTLARQEVFPVPADQFNHCVTVLKNADGTYRLLDPTWMPRSRDNWSTFEPEQHVVYGTPEGHGLLRSPYVPPTDNEVTWTSRVRLLPDGQMRGSLQLTAEGGPETLLRRAMGGKSDAERERAYEESLVRLSPQLKLVSLDATEPDDYSRPVEVSCEYFIPGATLGEGERRLFNLPMMRPLLGEIALSDLAGTSDLEQRKYALMLRTTRQARIEETIQLPPGWEVVKPPQAVSIQGPAAALEFTVDSKAGELHYVCNLTIKTHRVKPDDYAKFKEAIDAFERLGREYVVCSVGGEHASD
ncbi:MAG: DUF3857 domain-containing protein [Phycisphaerae bacterium]|jgi:transglutaminase-like putative cysteine protease